MPALEIREVDAVFRVDGHSSGAHSFRQGILPDGHRLGIDAGELVGKEFTEEWHALAVDLNSVGVSVARRNRLYLDLSASGIQLNSQGVPFFCEFFTNK